MKYYSAIRKDENPSFEATWMNLEDLMWSEISQAQTSTTCSHLFVESETADLREIENGKNGIGLPDIGKGESGMETNWSTGTKLVN
jgi:hypothetical protein